jgi:hypothetical protein
MLIAAEHLLNGPLDVPAHWIEFHIESVRFTKRVVFVGEAASFGPEADSERDLLHLYAAMSFGLFAPFNVTVTVVLFLCALAVAAAIETILDLSRPFDGGIRVSGQPLRHPLEVINQR